MMTHQPQHHAHRVALAPMFLPDHTAHAQVSIAWLVRQMTTIQLQLHVYFAQLEPMYLLAALGCVQLSSVRGSWMLIVTRLLHA